MKKQTLTIITEAGKNYGLGHLTRTLSIAKYFKNHNYSLEFLINADHSIIKFLNSYTYKLYNWLNLQTELLNDLKNSSLIILDSIEITDTLIKTIENLNIPIIFIDDYKRRNILNSGFVVDWTILSEKNNYFLPKKENVHYLLGSKYLSLRKEFNNIQRNKIDDDIKNIMITFGGADIRNLTPKILSILNRNFPDITKNIIIGNSFNDVDQIKLYKNEKTNFIFNADTSVMIDTMQKSDIAIACGGQTLYELAKIGLPSISILIVDNAKDDTYGWDKVGAIKYIGWYEDKNLEDNLINTVKNLKDKTTRQLMQNSTKKYLNSNGTEFLVNTILKALK